MKIAVLLTCHNRVEKTLDFLHSLVRVKCPQNVEIDVYLNDDGSTDGTREAVRAWYESTKPAITLHVLQGSGFLAYLCQQAIVGRILLCHLAILC